MRRHAHRIRGLCSAAYVEAYIGKATERERVFGRVRARPARGKR